MTTHREQAVDDLYERVAAILCQHVADTEAHEATAEAIDDWHGVTARTIVRVVRATPIVGPDMGTERNRYDRALADFGEDFRATTEGSRVTGTFVFRDGHWWYAGRAEPMSAEVVNNETALTGRAVHAAWRDGMLMQGRGVAPERMAWDTLTEQDQQLDDWIATRLAVRDDEEPRT